MASQAGFDIENKFINGLITESTALNFPKDACTDTLNCVFNEFGKVTRRPGLDIETGGSLNAYTAAAGDVWQDYLWYTSAATSNKAFFVQQRGNILHFFEVTDNITPSLNPFTTINLDTYVPSGSSLSSAGIACQFATGNGDLLVSNQNTNSIYVTYTESTNVIAANIITLKYRDTNGLQDGLRADERPLATVSGIKSSNPNHYYNLINQGWFAGTALADWDADRADLPSNADAVAYFRDVSDTQGDIYQEGSPAQIYPGNSPAPKGHFILNVGEDDRVGAAAAEGFSGFTPTGVTGDSSLISQSIGTIIGDFNQRSSTAFDGAINQSNNTSARTNSVLTGYIGKNYNAAGGFKCTGVLVYPTSSKAFTGGANVTIQLYGKTSAPSSSTDGTLLGSTGSITGTNQTPKFIVSSDKTTVYKYMWVRFSASSTTDIVTAEINFFSAGGYFYRPRCVAFYAGRSFYAGVDGTDTGANVYFSQVVVDKSKYGLCHQSNDPTSEKFADLLATDGGVIKIPDIGKVQKLFPFQNSLLVFANNGVWVISGNGNDGFAATGYKVHRLSNIGMTSPNSVVDVKGVPMWWAEDGIYTIQYDPNYDSSAVKTLTEETIKTYVLAVPAVNKQFIRATFDRLNNYVYFAFLSTAAINSDQAQTFDSILVFNAKTNAFFPWKIDNLTSNVPLFCGIEFITDGSRQLGGSVKLTTQLTVASTTYLTYSDFHDTSYKDYYNLMASNSAVELDYSSYLVAGYRVDAQAMRNFSSKYIWTFMENLDNSSIWLRGLWDFTNNANSGKWSTPQQAYNSLTTKGRTYDDVRVSRRVVRGSGKALQINYYSESGKPFNLIGWGLFEVGIDQP